MAYTVPYGTPRVRPAVVTAAVALLGLAVVGQVVGAGLTMSIAGTMRDAYLEAYQGSEMGADQMATIMNVSTIASAIISLVVATAMAALAILDAKGKQPARIVTWVLGGLYSCCMTFSLTGNLIGSAFMPKSTGGSEPDPTEVTRIVNDALPSWYPSVSMALSVIGLLSVLSAVILLALPAANAYFRKPAQEWEPPVPLGG